MRIINFRLIALSIFIHLSLARALRFRFTRCLFFSRYATARRRILSFIPFSPLALSLIVRCFAPSPPSRPVTRACGVLCVWRARACMCVCVCVLLARSASLGGVRSAVTSRGTFVSVVSRRLCVSLPFIYFGGSYTRKSGHDSRTPVRTQRRW